MADSKSTKDNNGTNDGLALIVGGLFVLALVFATYSYFNRTDNLNEEVSGTNTERLSENGEEKDELSLGERIKELFNSQKDTEGDLNGEGAAVGKSETEDETELTDMNEGEAVKGSVFAQWVANDYKEGDITGNTYTVAQGDTLWEIAEARYGNGAEWTKILEANASEIGYLANGQQALIVSGQVLTLP